jgi:hypothetical protein
LVRTRFGDSLAVVEWHPFSSDTFNINPDDSLRLARHQYAPGLPLVVVDGYLKVANVYDPSEWFAKCDSVVREAKAPASYVNLHATGEVTGMTGSVVIEMAIDSLAPGCAPILYCVVTEDSLVGMFGEVYSRVARRFVPDRNGIPVSLARGDTLRDTLTFATAGMRPDKLGAVVFVEDTSGTEPHRVLQATTIRHFTITGE